MKSIHSFAAALAMTSALTSGAIAATKVGVIGAANPQVFVERDGGARTVLEVGDEIYLNDKVSTDGKGSAQLMFLDKSALTISPESAVTIDTFVYDPAAKDGAMTVNGAKGAFRFIGGALTKKKAVNLKTPVSTIGIRGGIVDTHIDAGGQTDAVFLFGKEMTMTNAAGETTSTTQFGTGIGLTDGAALPAALPQNVVASRIAKSPTQAAIAAAPPAPAAKLEALENKVTLKAADKAAAAAPAASEGAATKPAGDKPAPSSNDQGTPTNDDSGSTPPASSQGTPDSGASGNGGDAPAATAEPKPEARLAPAPTGLGEGTGLKPMAMVAQPTAPATAPATSGTEMLYAKMDRVIKQAQSGETNGSTQSTQLFNAQKTPQKSSETLPWLAPRQSAPLATTETTLIREAAPSETTTATIEPALDAALEITEEPVLQTQTQTQTQTASSSTAAPTLPWYQLQQAPTLKGRSFHRENLGNDSLASNDSIESGQTDAYVDSANKLHFKLDRQTVRTGDYSNAPTSLSINDNSRYVVGEIALPSSGNYHSLGTNDVIITDSNGQLAADSLYGGVYVTDAQSFIFTDLSWIDQKGTAADFSDDEAVLFRSYVRSSLLDGVTDTATAQDAYNTMLTNAAGFASITGGIIEYDFLPELIGDYDSSGNLEFGQLDYNQHANFGSGDNSTGLLVDYTNKKFLGGYVDFTGSSGAPKMQALFGNVNANSVIAFDGSSNDLVLGKALEGKVYNLKQDSAGFNASNNEALGVNVKAASLASGLGANNAIEAMVVETHQLGTPTAIRSQQAAVIGDGATTSLLDNAPQAVKAYGYSAGLITSDNGSVSRLKTAGVYDVEVDAIAAGTASATVKYYETETSIGNFDSTQKTIKFGGSTVKNAALQEDLYAAEVNNIGTARPSLASTTIGAIVSMHEAIDPNQLVCSSCDFAHWGVWQADHIDSAGNVLQQTALVPYVAGQISTSANIADAVTDITAASQNPNAVKYMGDVAANVYDGSTLTNATGQFEAVLDLQNRRLTTYYANAGGIEFGFNTNDAAYTTSLGGNRIIAASTHATIGTAANEYTISGPNLEGYNFNSGTGQFNAPVVGVGAASPADVSGNINGTLFGDRAQELGGNFYVETTGGEKAGGIYLGKR